jgi:hypothetical protein
MSDARPTSISQQVVAKPSKVVEGATVCFLADAEVGQFEYYICILHLCIICGLNRCADIKLCVSKHVTLFQTT